MSDELVVLDGSTFLVSERSGDVVDGGTCRGFFYADTRHLSVWRVLIDGSPVTPLTSRNIDYYSARVVGVADGGRVGENPTMTIQRDRIVSDGIHEDISVENHADTARRVTVELRYATDFADLFEVKAERIRERAVTCSVNGAVVTLAYEHDHFRRGTKLEFTADGEIGPEAARFDLELQPHERWSLCIDVSCIDGQDIKGPRAGHGGFGQLHPQMPQTLEEWISEAPELDTDVDGIAHTYRRSLLDLAALRFMPFAGDESSLPAAGLPWFMAVLGRDSVISSYMALPFQPRLAAATLEVLARTQATEDDHGDKARVDSLTSNIGHLLWSGILTPERAGDVAEHLLSDELFNGWGVRTMASCDAGYNPIEYHNGTVWPHDTAIVAEGLRRYGFGGHAATLAMSVFDASEAFDHQSPEVFAGFDRQTTTVPVEYPTASRPQAWSSAAPLLALRTLLGLDVVDGALQASPILPDRVGKLALRGVNVRGKRVSVG